MPQNFSDPFKGEKNRSDYRVHGIQIDRLKLMVSMQKSGFKNVHRVFFKTNFCVETMRFSRSILIP